MNSMMSSCRSACAAFIAGPHGDCEDSKNDLQINKLQVIVEIKNEGIPEVIELFQSRIAKRMLQAVVPDVTSALKLDIRRQTHVEVPAFVDAVADAYFDPNVFFFDVILQRVTPDNVNGSLRDSLRKIVTSVLDEYPMIADRGSHLPADPAFVTRYCLSGIHGNWGPIGVEVPQISATVFLACNHSRKKIPAPFGDLPHDRLTVGTVRPSIHLAFDVADFNIDIDVPPWLTFISAGTVNLGAFLAEQGLEELADYLGGKAEHEVPHAVHSAVDSRSEQYGELISDTFRTIANRDLKSPEFSAVIAPRTDPRARRASLR
ncbi:MAG: hypothetical protein U5S82_17135 [Gammaproteobacteria bacterium]|nr:hypothetical protein [Gammaproteobacteria bacterium]